MSLTDVQNFLARIYTEADLRSAFLREPEKIGLEAGLTETEISELKQILPEDLNFFAESLFYKRFGEVGKLLPLTRESLGEKFEAHFREFAEQFNPASVKKHYEDAVEFCRFLRRKKLVPDFAGDAAQFEQAALEFGANDKSFIFKVFDYDLKTKKKRKNLRLWLRVGERRFIF